MMNLDTMITSNIDNNDDEEKNDANRNLKKLYQELADKEQALIMAAEFGKNLIDEKEELERQIDLMRKDNQFQVDGLEQELYQLKRLIESVRNEYDTKIYELNEDVNILNKKLKQSSDYSSSSSQSSSSSSSSSKDNNDNDYIDLDLIQELNEKNQKLSEELKHSEIQFSVANENCQILESKLGEKESVINEDAKLIANCQKEITKLLNKQQELEFVLMQACTERDKQVKIIEELTQKYIYAENEKSELENLVYQHENDMFNLQRINQDLLFKLEKLNNNNSKVGRKRRSSSSIHHHQRHHQNNISSSSPPPPQPPGGNNSLSSNSLMNNSSTSPDDSTTNNNNKQQSGEQQPSSFSQTSANIYTSNPFVANRSYFDSDEYDDIDVNTDDIFRLNEIEQDDDDDEDAVMYLKNAYLDEESDSMEGISGCVNWQQEANEHRLIDDDDDDDADDDEEEDDDNYDEKSSNNSINGNNGKIINVKSETTSESNNNDIKNTTTSTTTNNNNNQLRF